MVLIIIINAKLRFKNYSIMTGDMKSIFPELPDGDDVPNTFQELWNSLVGRNKQRYEYFRGHQLKILEMLYERIHQSDKKDYAISLPTGTGKTLIGLLLSYYLMRKEKLTALYLCPNIHLCKQVLRDASDLDIPAVPLYGKWSEISAQDRNNFISGHSVGIATYNTLFNSNPRVGKVGMLVMDDVHAAGDAITSNWSIKIERARNPALFDQVYEKIHPILNSSQKNAIEANPDINEPYEMLYTRQWLNVIDDLRLIFETYTSGDDIKSDDNIKFHWKNVKDKLENYFCILHRNSIEIRPLTPPTQTLNEFNEAKYRFYMSATLDDTGNLENNVGIEGLEWISLSDIDVPGIRLIFNLDSLMPKITDENRVISIVQKINKTIILTQSSVQQSILKDALKNIHFGGAIFSPNSDNISNDLEEFKNQTKAVLLLAGRYDGIDLGDGKAQGIIMFHLPQAINSLESFTTLKWETSDESEARAIQRVHQGMGRCTRRDSDEVQIFLIGEDLVKLILNPQTLSTFLGKLRAELEICKEMKEPNLLDSFLEAFRNKTQDWIELKERIIKKAGKYAGSLEGSLDKENIFVFSKYSSLLWAGNYQAAQSLATQLMQKFNSKGREKDSAIWAYLGGVASDISAFKFSKNPFLEPGNELFLHAVSTAKNREWFGTLSNYVQEDRIQQPLENRVEIIYSSLSKFSPEHNKLKEHTDDLIKKLESGEDKNVKQFFQEFGTLLGFDTLIPSRQGSPDCIWSSNGNVSFIFEAKTNKTNDYLTIEEVRQIIAIPGEVKSNEKLKVSGDLLPVCVTNVHKIAKEEKHNAKNFYVLRTSEVSKLANDWFSRLSDIQNIVFKDINYLKPQIQYALINQRLTEQDLRTKLCKSKGIDVLKVQ